MRNTICKHVHAVVRLYAPVQTGNTTFSVSAMQNDETPAVTAMDDSEAADSDCSVPDVGAEMVPVIAANSVPQLSETDAILHHLVGVSDNTEQSVVKADMLLASIRCAINISETHSQSLTPIVDALAVPTLPLSWSVALPCDEELSCDDWPDTTSDVSSSSEQNQSLFQAS